MEHYGFPGGVGGSAGGARLDPDPPTQAEIAEIGRLAYGLLRR